LLSLSVEDGVRMMIDVYTATACMIEMNEENAWHGMHGMAWSRLQMNGPEAYVLDAHLFDFSSHE